MAKFVEKEAVVVADTKKLRWYKWNQNNSGGSFHVNDDVTHRIYIEAYSYEEAERKALGLGVYYNGCDDGSDCPCCGDRWYEGDEVTFPLSWGKELNFNNIEEYAGYMTDNYGWCSPDAYLYYHDGRKVEVYSDKVK